jgi:tetratricopeptide (TPR) repeat protein
MRRLAQPSGRARLAAVLFAAALGPALAGCGATLVAVGGAAEDETTRLGREITKVRFAIESTKGLIDRSRGQAYLPDLYLRLAELYVEEARYHYFIAYEGQKRRSRAVDAVQPRLLKNQAIGIYKRILDEFPDYRDADKVLFFISHEYRELGEYERMIEYLDRVVKEHAKSSYANEALLVLGDYYFDRSELATAAKHYERILTGPESTSHAMARYKLAWVRINDEEWKAALSLFEATIEGLEKIGPAGAQRVDLRREALVDMVFPYTEVHKKAKARQSLDYFRKLADSRTSYLAALSKLAKRWFVKGEYETASGIYREILRLGADDEDSVEWARRLYDGVIKGRSYGYVAQDVPILIDVVARRAWDWRLPETARNQMVEEFEVYARDLATKAQLRAQKKKSGPLLERVGDAYEAYLAFFTEAASASAIRQNLAETRWAAEQWLPAARAYDALVRTASTTPDEATLGSAVAAYARALEKPWKLDRVDRVQARAALREAARRMIATHPKAATMKAVKFNLARTYYDEGAFTEAAELFAALVDEFPASDEALVAAELALDALRIKERYEEMAALGARLSADARLPAKLREEVGAIVKSAEARALEVATLEAGYQGDEAARALLDFADKHRGTPLGERALLNAFATAKNSDDLDEVVKIGDQLLKTYPSSDTRSDVLATLGQMSSQAADFGRAADYFEDAAKARKADETAAALLQAAAVIEAHLGDLDGARQSYERVFRMLPTDAARRDAALALAALMELSGDYRQAARALQVAQDAGADAPSVAFRLGYALLKTGDPALARNQLEAARGATGESSPEELEGVAGAAYWLAEPTVQSFERIDAGGGMADAIQRKFAALGAVEEALLAVVDLGSPKWALAALARLGGAYGNAARFLRSAPAPAGLEGAGLERYQAAIGARAKDLEAKREEAIETCASQAGQLKVFSLAVRACRLGEAFRGDPEQRPKLAGRRKIDESEAASLRRRIAKNSKDYDALAALAVLYLRASDPLAAKLVLDKAAEGGADASTYNLRAVVSHLLGLDQAAYEDLRAALDEDSAYAPARLNLAALYRVHGYAAEAEAERAKLTGAGLPPAGDPRLFPEASR